MTIPRPMRLQSFHILLALSGGSLHGYAIQRSILDRTEGGLRLWPATLYRLLEALEREGYIEVAEDPGEGPRDQRCTYYALTSTGASRLRDEASMRADWARVAAEAPQWNKGGAQ